MFYGWEVINLYRLYIENQARKN